MNKEKYNIKYAVAAARGYFKRKPDAYKGEVSLLCKELSLLSEGEQEEIMRQVEIAGIKARHFKNSDRQLPRVNKVLGFLKGIYFETLLDVGSGHGVFLIPFLEDFPYVEVSSVDILPERIEMLSDLSLGGVDNLTAEVADICSSPYEKNSFDVVTMLEVLEHIPDVEAAIRSAVETARKYVIITVPSKEDSNPDHIHLLTKEKLTALFNACGVTRLTFDSVPGHLFMIAKKEER